jgi:hypothetical protein
MSLALMSTGCRAPAPVASALPAPAPPPAVCETPDPPGQSYDRRLCDSVGTRWAQILRQTGADDHGRVVLGITLHEDGTFTDLSVILNAGGEALQALSEAALRESAPFPAWNPALKKEFGGPRRLVFAFEFDALGRPCLGCRERSSGLADSAKALHGSGVVWYFPTLRRWASATSRPWAGEVMPEPADDSGSSSEGPIDWFPQTSMPSSLCRPIDPGVFNPYFWPTDWPVLMQPSISTSRAWSANPSGPPH